MTNKDHKVALSPRLQKIFSLVPKNHCTADIGTDHAYIPIALVESGVCERAIASDIKQGPLKRAETNIRRCGLSSKIDARLGAGLETLSPADAEVIIIAGMGGILIADILEASRAVTDSAKYLILQPMTATAELREYLSQNGYTVDGEYLEAEENKLYNIITAIPSGETPYSVRELYLGKGLDKTSPELFPLYQASVLKKLNKKIDGLEKSESEENKIILNNLKELLKTLREENSK